MSQPTAISDISTVTGVADVLINGTALWASPGANPAGRYWTLIAAADSRLAGVVVEHHNGRFEALIGSNGARSGAHTATAHDAALLIVAALHSATPEGAE
ncbi:hypothetical protein ACH4E7_07035 [Kitasatospora sp. NPDC018058]|uniref:hypothetical protein n=1 Tax=Kitasatospora sp. NPDC018058 TaxID=3364025 RepID=UPI0037C0D91C